MKKVLPSLFTTAARFRRTRQRTEGRWPTAGLAMQGGAGAR